MSKEVVKSGVQHHVNIEENRLQDCGMTAVKLKIMTAAGTIRLLQGQTQILWEAYQGHETALGLFFILFFCAFSHSYTMAQNKRQHWIIFKNQKIAKWNIVLI